MRTDKTLEERRGRIMALLVERRRMTVDELAAHFHVTGATIRTDLTALMHQNRLIRTLGSAMIVEQGPVFPLAERLKIMADEKRAIGKRAAALVQPGDIIAFDASSTTLAMAPFLRGIENLTILTNCLAVANEFVSVPQAKVIMPGGYLQHESSSLVGDDIVNFLKRSRVQTAFIGARSIGIETGLCDSDPATMEFKRRLIQISKKVVALVDSSKWDLVALTSFASLDQIHVLVSDAKIAPRHVRSLASHNIQVLTC